MGDLLQRTTMPINDLKSYISLLESRDELTSITVPVDPRLEIAAITNRVCKQTEGGRALLFEQPKGSDFPVATNLFGSMHRTCLALGIADLDQLTTKMTALLDRIPEFDITRLDLQIAALQGFSRFAPVPAPPCWSEVMEQPDLTVFPFLQSWPGDGSADGHSRYITLPQVVSAEPDGSNPNCGIYRAQVRGKRELALRWKAGSGAARHLEKFRQQGKPMPVAIALGGPPAALFSAMLPLPGDLDEMAFAGFLRGTPIGMAACRTVPLQVPATAEVVIEGFVDPAETVREGPFGNHTGSYSPAGPASLLRVTGISHRPGAVIPATLVGPPPMEDCWMAKAWERLLLAFLKKLVPSVAEIHFPLEWIFHQSAVISLEKPNPAMVREIASRLWDTPWFSDARLIIFVAADAAPANEREIAWRCINLTDYAHDIFYDSTGQRMTLDATACRLPRQSLHADPATELRVLQRWQEYGIPLK
jgi:4-hydroxy-3-polyprenylbenzoate decarboxylase